MTQHFPCRVLQPKDQAASFYTAIKQNPNNELSAPTPNSRRKRSVGLWQKFWGNGRELSISFMEHTPKDIQQRIENAIMQWERSTNLQFKFIDTPGVIRIFVGGNTNSSYGGTDALLVPHDQPTLRIADAPDSDRFEGTVLHEFGHALGFVHEHQHPKANIPWDIPKLYEYYARHFNWTQEEVDREILTPVSEDLLLGPYDKKSIMHYSVTNEVTLGDWEVVENNTISKLDRRNARKAYPKP